MADRSVTVRLRADISQFRRAMRESSGDASRLGRDVDAAGNRIDKFGASSAGAARDIDGMGASSRRAGSEIDTLSGRISLFVKAGAAIGPAFAPIGALAVPALASLANVAGAAGLALGTTLLAFQGFGDALSKLDKAQLEPTAEHISAARSAMEQLSPAARDFLAEIDHAQGSLAQLQKSAGKNMFPGLTDGLDAALTQLPRARGLMEALGGAVGNLGKMTGESLASGKWSGFLDFLRTEMPPTIEALGHSVGSLTHGMAELWMAFAPLNSDITAGLADAAKDFDMWASNLSGTEGFQEFISYLRDAGPEVGHTLTAIGGALLDVAVAAAPLGGPVLDILTAFANALSAIADSPVGTPLLGIASAVSALSLLNKGLSSTRSMMSGGLFGGAGAAAAAGAGAEGGIGSFFADNADDIKEAVGSIKTNVGSIGAVMGTAGARTERESRRMSLAIRGVASASVRLVGATARMAAPLAGLALSATDVDDKMGLSNTAMFAMYGTMAGPWGAAVGAGIGLMTDLKASSEQAGKAQEDLDAVFSNSASSVTDYFNALDAAKKKRQDLYEDEQSYTGVTDFVADTVSTNASIFSGKGVSLVDDIDTTEAEGKIKQLAFSLYTLYDVTGGTNIPEGSIWGDPSKSTLVLNMGAMEQIARQAQPAMAALGITLDDLASVDSTSEFNSMMIALGQWQSNADSAQGRTQALADVFAGLRGQLLSTADGAEQVKSALSALLDPQMNLAAASDQWNDGLRNLKDSLDDTSHSLVGNTDGASKNRDAIRTQVKNLEDLVNAQAQNGASGEKLARTMRDGRKAIVDLGGAAGLSKQEVGAYLRTLGLTPKAVRTLLSAQTEQATSAVQALKSLIDSLHDRDINIRVNKTTNATLGEAAAVGPSKSPKKKADGGSVPHGGPYQDRHHYLLAPGEEVISNRFGQADRNRPLLKAINAGRLADGGTVDALFNSEGPRFYRQAFRHNKPFAKSAPMKWTRPYQTNLTAEQEVAFRAWVADSEVPFDPNARLADYDMRGYWKKTKGADWSSGSHFPDTFKTPYDTTFSRESKYATKDNPFYWQGDRLIDQRNGQIVFAANGSTVPHGGSYQDRHHYLLAPGEEVISNRFGQADRNRPLLKAINAGRLADGGTAGDDGKPDPKDPKNKKKAIQRDVISFGSLKWSDVPDRTFKGITKSVKEAQRAFDKSTEKVKAETDARDQLLSDFNSLAADIAGQFKTTLFQPMTEAVDVWRSDLMSNTADPIQTLTDDIANSEAFNSLFEQLTARGASVASVTAAGQQGGVEGLNLLAGYSNDQLAQYSTLFARRETSAASTGTAVAQAQYGQKLDESNSKLATQVAQNDKTHELLNDLKHVLNQLDNTNRTGSDMTAGAVRALGGNVAAGRRNRRGGGRG